MLRRCRDCRVLWRCKSTTSATSATPSSAVNTQNEEEAKLLEMYRTWGYRHAATSPFSVAPRRSPLTQYLDQASVNVNARYKELYCGSVGVQYMHIPDIEKQNFMSHLIESKPTLDSDTLRDVTKVLLRSEGLDNYLNTKFANLKQYGAEGAEGTLAFCQLLFQLCPQNKVDEVVIGIAHRGRISLLTELLQLSYDRLLKKYSGFYEFHPDEAGLGDVLSHLWQSVDLTQPDGGHVHVSLLPNPSHLEVVNAVALGKVRAKMKDAGTAPYYGDNEKSPLALLIHGDAAFLGQGITFENAQMSKLENYGTNGTIHLITNNLIGFTSVGNSLGSSFSAGDVGKMYDIPVIAVNGLDIAAIYHAVHMAMTWRAKYKEDVIIDLQCYRFYGHNQHDEPRFTNPAMYKQIETMKSLPRLLAENLVQEKILQQDDIEHITKSQQSELTAAYNNAASYSPPRMNFNHKWSGMRQSGDKLTTWDTGYPVSHLQYIGLKSVELPDSFTPHPTLYRAHINKRRSIVETGEGVDWSTAETLAFGSLILQGYNVRISGEDVPRGTFSHRHMTMYDQNTELAHTPLNHMLENQPGKVEACCSLLSEEAVVGFEYGYSIENPNTLVLWEAQFGDFFTPAQVLYDTFVSSGEAKWILQSGLVSLLPHGYDGNGPDHTSARLERWLQMSDSKETVADGDHINLQVVNLTTPAQYYHALRRQLVRPFRKPLIVMSPKALLRSPDALSNISELGPGTTFSRVLGDNTAQPSSVKRVLVCSGKHYYTLLKKREELGDTTTAIVRIEEICPFPASELQSELKKYPEAECYWAQEEARNGGAWSFVSTRVKNILGIELEYAGRAECAATTVGVSQWHVQECREILEAAFSHLK